jgi:hypothetical protein
LGSQRPGRPHWPRRPRGPGKTSLAETAPGPRLILDAEGGTDWLSSDTVTWDPTQGAPPAVEGDVSVVVHVLNWEMIERVTRWLQKGEHSFLAEG